MMKLRVFIPYLKKIQEIYKLRAHSLSSAGVFKDCFNKHGCNFDDVNKIGYSRHSSIKGILK